MHLSEIAVVFLTCPRTPSYLAQTLASFGLGDARVAGLHSVAVAVDAEDVGCAGELAGLERVRWVVRTAEESALVAGFAVHRRACASYSRALRLAEEAVAAGARGVLVCEDDVVFRNGWVGMLEDALGEMEGLGEFLLTLYSGRDHEEEALRRGRFYSSYVAAGFYGTQALFYTAGEVAPCREVVWRCGVETAEEPYDLLLKRRAISQQHLYTTRHSLVQHAGVVSTGLGWGHRSPSFERAWPEGMEGNLAW